MARDRLMDQATLNLHISREIARCMFSKHEGTVFD